MDMNKLRLEALRRVMGNLSQAEFADAHDLNASYISQILSGHRSFGERAATNMEKKIGLTPGTLSRPPIDQDAEATDRESNVIAADFSKKRADMVDIPRLDVAGSMGFGVTRPDDHEDVIDRLRVSTAWLRRNVNATNHDNLAVITGYGDSMEGTFNDGDLLLVDRGITDIKIDAVYVLALNGELYIKRLQRRPDGTILMLSDNEKYKPYEIKDGELDRFEVLGRVLLAWNARRL